MPNECSLTTQRTGQRKLIWFLFAVAERSVRLAGTLVSLWLWHAGWEYAGIALIVAICMGVSQLLADRSQRARGLDI